MSKVKNKTCPRCGTELINKQSIYVKDYCPKCKDGLVFVIDFETGEGKPEFFNEYIKRNNKYKIKMNQAQISKYWLLVEQKGYRDGKIPFEQLSTLSKVAILKERGRTDDQILKELEKYLTHKNNNICEGND